MWKQEPQDQIDFGNLSPCGVHENLGVGSMLAQVVVFRVGV